MKILLICSGRQISGKNMKKITYDEVYAIVIKVLTEDFKKPIEDLKPETSLKEELSLDSLDRVDFLCAVEERYGD